jgi:hypothetical protein
LTTNDEVTTLVCRGTKVAKESSRARSRLHSANALLWELFSKQVALVH